MTNSDDDAHAARLRRAAYRSAHRGTKEMDLLMGRYADAHLGAMSDADLRRFETLLALPDPDLQRWILGGAAAAPDVADLVDDLRRFHGLAPRR